MRARHLGILGLFVGAMLANACAVAPSTTPPATDAIAAIVEPQAPRAEAPAAPIILTRPTRTAVVVSDDIPEYEEIVDEILERGTEGVTVHRLSGQFGNADRVLDEIGNAHASRIIAVGLLAATVARRIPSTPMVFCQVYNYQDHDLLSATSKGVQLLPPFDMQLRAWRQLGFARNLRSIGVITGPGQDELIAEIRRAVAPAGITLMVRTVEYDQATLLAFKDFAPDIDGLWLLPDNRILSPDVVREVMSYGAKHLKQIVVFGESLLGMGALLGVSNQPSDVVDRVFARFADSDADGRLRGPDLLPLTNIRMQVNAATARALAPTDEERVARSR